jgi:hypothetical protein
MNHHHVELAAARSLAESIERGPLVFTIDVPFDLHQRVKVECARRGVQMCHVIRDTLEREFPKN